MKDRFEASKAGIADARRRFDRLLGEVDATWKASIVDRSRVLANLALVAKSLAEAEAVLVMTEIHAKKNADLLPESTK